jgi:hypothetical protein
MDERGWGMRMVAGWCLFSKSMHQETVVRSTILLAFTRNVAIRSHRIIRWPISRWLRLLRNLTFMASNSPEMLKNEKMFVVRLKIEQKWLKSMDKFEIVATSTYKCEKHLKPN